jgi:hypothetical protein
LSEAKPIGIDPRNDGFRKNSTHPTVLRVLRVGRISSRLRFKPASPSATRAGKYRASKPPKQDFVEAPTDNKAEGDLGPRLLPMGSLAALLWLDLLRRHGVHISTSKFILVGFPVTVPSLALSLLLLIAMGER